MFVSKRRLYFGKKSVPEVPPPLGCTTPLLILGPIIIGAILGYFFPYVTFGVIAILLFVDYRLGGARIEQLKTAAWTYLTDIKFLGKVISYVKPNEVPSFDTETPPGGGFSGIPVNGNGNGFSTISTT